MSTSQPSPSNSSLHPNDRRDTLNPFEIAKDDNILVEFEPQWYKERYLVNYESQDDQMFVLTQQLIDKVIFRISR